MFRSFLYKIFQCVFLIFITTMYNRFYASILNVIYFIILFLCFHKQAAKFKKNTPSKGAVLRCVFVTKSKKCYFRLSLSPLLYHFSLRFLSFLCYSFQRCAHFCFVQIYTFIIRVYVYVE